jgi:hypothetical protein
MRSPGSWILWEIHDQFGSAARSILGSNARLPDPRATQTAKRLLAFLDYPEPGTQSKALRLCSRSGAPGFGAGPSARCSPARLEILGQCRGSVDPPEGPFCCALFRCEVWQGRHQKKGICCFGDLRRGSRQRLEWQGDSQPAQPKRVIRGRVSVRGDDHRCDRQSGGRCKSTILPLILASVRAPK